MPIGRLSQPRALRAAGALQRPQQQHAVGRPAARAVLRRERERSLGRDLRRQRQGAGDRGPRRARGSRIRHLRWSAHPGRLRVGGSDRDLRLLHRAGPRRPQEHLRHQCRPGGERRPQRELARQHRPVRRLRGVRGDRAALGDRRVLHVVPRRPDRQGRRRRGSRDAAGEPVREPGRGQGPRWHQRQQLPAAERHEPAHLRPVPDLGSATER